LKPFKYSIFRLRKKFGKEKPLYLKMHEKKKDKLKKTKRISFFFDSKFFRLRLGKKKIRKKGFLRNWKKKKLTFFFRRPDFLKKRVFWTKFNFFSYFSCWLDVFSKEFFRTQVSAFFYDLKKYKIFFLKRFFLKSQKTKISFYRQLSKISVIFNKIVLTRTIFQSFLVSRFQY